MVGGYFDRGWGIFVATPRILEECNANSKTEEHLIVPLTKLKAIVLPTPLVESIRKEFPEHKYLLKGYRELGIELGRKRQN